MSETNDENERLYERGDVVWPPERPDPAGGEPSHPWAKDEKLGLLNRIRRWLPWTR
jgi:hypothetical protein